MAEARSAGGIEIQFDLAVSAETTTVVGIVFTGKRRYSPAANGLGVSAGLKEQHFRRF
jgi:hypothetical protein